MIKIVAKHTIKQDKINDFIAAFKPLIKDTTQTHRGCIHYELFQDMDNPSILTVIEEWENQASLNEHMETELFRKTLESMKEYLDGPVELSRYQKVG